MTNRPLNIREKILDIIVEHDMNPIEIGRGRVADTILSLIIQSLPEEKDVRELKHDDECSHAGYCCCDLTDRKNVYESWNTYRSELIKLLKGEE